MVTVSEVAHGADQVLVAGSSSTAAGLHRARQEVAAPHEPGALAAVPADAVGRHLPRRCLGGDLQVERAAEVDARGAGVARDAVPHRAVVGDGPVLRARLGVLGGDPPVAPVGLDGVGAGTVVGSADPSAPAATPCRRSASSLAAPGPHDQQAGHHERDDDDADDDGGLRSTRSLRPGLRLLRVLHRGGRLGEATGDRRRGRGAALTRRWRRRPPRCASPTGSRPCRRGSARPGRRTRSPSGACSGRCGARTRRAGRRARR